MILRTGSGRCGVFWYDIPYITWEGDVLIRGTSEFTQTQKFVVMRRASDELGVLTGTAADKPMNKKPHVLSEVEETGHGARARVLPSENFAFARSAEQCYTSRITPYFGSKNTYTLLSTLKWTRQVVC